MAIVATKLSEDSLNYAPTQRTRQVERRVRLNIQDYSVDVNPEWQVNSSPIILRNAAAIQEQVINVFSVLVGEEHFEPMFGSNIPLRLFEPAQKGPSGLSHLLSMDSIRALEMNMRGVIKLVYNETYVSVDPLDEEAFVVQVTYVIVATGVKDNFEFNLLIPR